MKEAERTLESGKRQKKFFVDANVLLQRNLLVITELVVSGLQFWVQ